MKTNQEILDFLGQKIINNCYDGAIEHTISVREKIDPSIIFREKSDFLKSLSDEQFEKIKKIIGNSVEIVLFEFFSILEENPQYKIIYEEDGLQVDLTKISEMLKAEHLSEDGWIERFSKFKTEK
jgi:hypothetical protein